MLAILLQIEQLLRSAYAEPFVGELVKASLLAVEHLGQGMGWLYGNLVYAWCQVVLGDIQIVLSLACEIADTRYYLAQGGAIVIIC